MEGRYPPAVWLALADCTDPAREEDFNRWYNTALIPELESLGFVRNTRRYENLLGGEPSFRGRPKYLALSEVYRDDVEDALKEMRHFFNRLRERSLCFDAMVLKVDTLYRRIGPEFRTERTGRTGRAVRGLQLALSYCTDTTREGEFNRWYDERHSPETVQWGYHDTGYRYKVVDLNDPTPHQSAPYLSFYETSIDPQKAVAALSGFREQCLSDERWVNLLGMYFGGGFRQIYPAPK